MQNGNLLHSARRNTLDLQLHQTSRQLALAEPKQLPPLFYLSAVLLDPPLQLLALPAPASDVEAELSDQSVVFPVFLMEVLVGKGGVFFISQLRQSQSLSAVAEVKHLDKVSKLRVVAGVPGHLQRSSLGNKLRFVSLFLRGFGLSFFGEQLAASSHNIMGRRGIR